MKVWIVECCYPYEGCTVEKVFGTEEEADAYAAAANTERGYTSGGPFQVADWPVSTSASPKGEP